MLELVSLFVHDKFNTQFKTKKAFKLFNMNEDSTAVKVSSCKNREIKISR